MPLYGCGKIWKGVVRPAMNVHLMNHWLVMMWWGLLNDHFRILYGIVEEIVESLWRGSREVVGESSRGMFEVDKDDPGPEYNEDGIVVPFANVIVGEVFDDDALI